MSRERERHKLSRDIDYDGLKRTLSARLKRPVELVARPPTATEYGEIMVIDAVTDEPIKVDPTVMQSVISLADDRPDPRSLEEVAIDEMDKAANENDKIAAIRMYLQRLVETEQARIAIQPASPMEPFANVFAAAQQVSRGPAESLSQIKRGDRNSRSQPKVRHDQGMV